MSQDRADAEQVLLHHQFPLLDTLRAVGALAVFTTHAAYWAGAYAGHGVWGTVLSRLDVGVAIFFVLSGFLLSRPHLARAAVGREAPGLGRYYYKRALRIAPVYLITVVLALGLITRNDDAGGREWVVTLLMANTFVDATMPNGLTHMWSLAVEVCFYLVLPALMLLATGRSRAGVPRRLRPPRVLALVLAMLVVSVLWDLWWSPAVGGETSAQPGQWLPSYLGWFGIGILLALVDVLHRRGEWQRLTTRVVGLAQQPGSCWAIAAGLLLVVATPVAGPSMLAAPTPGELLTKHLVYGAIGGLLVLTGVFARPGTGYHRVLGHRRARHLGFISYGFFCLHLPVLHLVMWVTGWEIFDGRLPAIWALALVVSLGVAEVAYRLVEAPLMRLKDVGRRSAATRTEATTGTSAR